MHARNYLERNIAAYVSAAGLVREAEASGLASPQLVEMGHTCLNRVEELEAMQSTVKAHLGALHCVSLEDVYLARNRIRAYTLHTPVFTCEALDAMASAVAGLCVRLHFKCELFQRTGSFKARGATNAVMHLKQHNPHSSVCTHSSGNHAAALAYAAQHARMPAYIVMPSDAPAVKRASVVGYGGEVTECAPNLTARQQAASALCALKQATFVHPSEDPLVIAGQGTCALELLEDAGE